MISVLHQHEKLHWYFYSEMRLSQSFVFQSHVHLGSTERRIGVSTVRQIPTVLLGIRTVPTVQKVLHLQLGPPLPVPANSVNIKLTNKHQNHLDPNPLLKEIRNQDKQ